MSALVFLRSCEAFSLNSAGSMSVSVTNAVSSERAVPAIHMNEAAAKAAWLARQEADWPRAAAPTLSSAQMKGSERYNPEFGDNTYARRKTLSAPTTTSTAAEADGATQSWYYPEQATAADQFEPQFGDNTYARRESLAQGGVPVATAPATSDWYYPEQAAAADQFAPQFGDNTYARRESLAQGGVVVPTAPATSDWYYPEQAKSTDQFAPQFGDNTYARRQALSRGA